jgi:hypothetical protein
VVCGGLSLPIRINSEKRPSIVDRLAARSVTGQILDIRIYQHTGYRVHFEWNGGNDNKDKYRAMERSFFMYSDAQSFCIELCKFGLEGICSCIYGAYHSYIPVKASYCRLGPFYANRKYFEFPKWWLKSMEEMEVDDFCGCDVSSTGYTGRSHDPINLRCWCHITSSVTLDWHWTPQENPPPINEGTYLRL